MKLTALLPTAPEPMPEGGVLRSRWRVGRRLVTLTQLVACDPRGVGSLRVEWRPDMPRKLSKRELHDYRRGRNAHFQRVANVLGGALAIVE
jgi:hypothetical protein